MAIGITITKKTPEHGTAVVQLTGLTPGVKYDVLRMRVQRHISSAGTPTYTRIFPDRKAYWSSVAHRVGWTAPSATVTFNDYETPITSVQYFIVEASKTSPFEWDWDRGDYPVTTGILSPTVDFWWDLTSTPGANQQGQIRIRSTAHAQKYFDACVVEMGDMKYTARGTELAVLGNPYPLYVADVRESRRGSIIVKCSSLADVLELQRIVFPANGKVWPIVFNSASEPALIANDMTVIPLDITIEQATPNDVNLRFVHIDYVEIDPTTPLMIRVKDNVPNHPDARFSISDTTPAVNQKIVLTDASTGQFDRWHWYTPGAYEGLVSAPEVNNPPTSRRVNKFIGQGPWEIFYRTRGKHKIKLWVGDQTPETTAGADVIKKIIVVH